MPGSYPAPRKTSVTTRPKGERLLPGQTYALSGCRAGLLPAADPIKIIPNVCWFLWHPTITVLTWGSAGLGEAPRPQSWHTNRALLPFLEGFNSRRAG